MQQTPSLFLPASTQAWGWRRFTWFIRSFRNVTMFQRQCAIYYKATKSFSKLTINPLVSSEKVSLLFLFVVINPFSSQKFRRTHLKYKTFLNFLLAASNFLELSGHLVINTWGTEFSESRPEKKLFWKCVCYCLPLTISIWWNKSISLHIAVEYQVSPKLTCLVL